jgi:hypothetical protein
MGLATASAIGGRTAVGWVMPVDADRRVVASAGYAVQIAGSIIFIAATHERTVAPTRSRIVWRRHRQCDIVAATDFPSRIP